ncbi:MAG: hypothetical protein ACREM8_07170, partial [Vulcanimicrobiaceae bacterium]
MSAFAVWRSRLPTAIASWFARDLVGRAMPLISSGCVELRLVEQERIEALVRDRGPVEVVVEWGGGTGPFALRPICTCP